MRSITRDITKTLSYAGIFHLPLTSSEIHEWLISKNIVSRKAVDYELKGNKKWHSKHNRYSLDRFLISSQEQLNRHNCSEEKLNTAKRYASILGRIPTVHLVGLSGSTAVMNAKKEDDIDFFIITGKNTLWLTRILVLIVLQILGKRRERNKREIRDSICVNMFMSLPHLSLPEKEHDVFSAHEILQMKPLYAKDFTYEKFLSANGWVSGFLANKWVQKQKDIVWQTRRKVRSQHAGKTVNTLISPVNTLLFLLQLMFMKKHKTREIVLKNYVRFHPDDARIWILNEYYRRILPVLKDKE